MDIDIADDTQLTETTQQQPKRPVVPVDDAHPFDLESYISNYTGRTVVDRLIHIVSICPAIAPEALILAVQHIYQSRDPSLYQILLSAYEQLQSFNPDLTLPDPSEIHFDTKWADDTLAQNQADKTKLEVELKTYSNNMIKESIRMAHRDLGDFYRATGDFSTSLKHYTKSREFFTTSSHILEMCLSILELLIEQRNYSHIITYVFKSDAALEAATSAAASNASASSSTAPGTSTGGGAPASKKRSTEHHPIQSKLDLASALSHLGQAVYDKAAFHFVRLGPIKDLGDWVGKLVSASDIAIYATLCALASFSRSAIKSQLLDNPSFGAYLEQEPYVRELLEAYMRSDFKVVLEGLERYSTRHTLDPHLYAHLPELIKSIRNWAVVLYFKPFASIRLERMGAAFGWSVEEVEREVVGLIKSGQVVGRVDSRDKILHAKQTDYRAELFARAMKAAETMQSANRKLLLRMRLQQAELVIKPPKGQHLSSNLVMSDYMLSGGD